MLGYNHFFIPKRGASHQVFLLSSMIFKDTSPDTPPPPPPPPPPDVDNQNHSYTQSQFQFVSVDPATVGKQLAIYGKNNICTI